MKGKDLNNGNNGKRKPESKETTEEIIFDLGDGNNSKVQKPNSNLENDPEFSQLSTVPNNEDLEELTEWLSSTQTSQPNIPFDTVLPPLPGVLEIPPSSHSENSTFALTFLRGDNTTEDLSASSMILLSSIYWLANYEFDKYSFSIEAALSEKATKQVNHYDIFTEENGITINGLTVTISAENFKKFVETKVVYSVAVLGVVELFDSLKNEIKNKNKKIIGHFRILQPGNPILSKVSEKLTKIDITHRSHGINSSEKRNEIYFDTNVREMLEKHLFVPAFRKNENPPVTLREKPLEFKRILQTKENMPKRNAPSEKQTKTKTKRMKSKTTVAQSSVDTMSTEQNMAVLIPNPRTKKSFHITYIKNNQLSKDSKIFMSFIDWLENYADSNNNLVLDKVSKRDNTLWIPKNGITVYDETIDVTDKNLLKNMLNEHVNFEDEVYVYHGIYKLIKQSTADNNIFKLNIACRESIFDDVAKRLKRAFKTTFNLKKYVISQEFLEKNNISGSDVFHYSIEIDDRNKNTILTFEKEFFTDNYIAKYKNNVQQEQSVNVIQPSLPVAQPPVRIDTDPEDSIFVLGFSRGGGNTEGLTAASTIILTSIYYLSNYEFDTFSFSVEKVLVKNAKKSSLEFFKPENGIVIKNNNNNNNNNKVTVTIDAAKFKNFIEKKVAYSLPVLGIIELWDSLKNATANVDNKFTGYFSKATDDMKAKVTNKLKQLDIKYLSLDSVNDFHALSFDTNIAATLENYLFLPEYKDVRKENPQLLLRATPLTFDRKRQKKSSSVNNNNASLESTVPAQQTTMKLSPLPLNSSMSSVVVPGTFFSNSANSGKRKQSSGNTDEIIFLPDNTDSKVSKQKTNAVQDSMDTMSTAVIIPAEQNITLLMPLASDKANKEEIKFKKNHLLSNNSKFFMSAMNWVENYADSSNNLELKKESRLKNSLWTPTNGIKINNQTIKVTDKNRLKDMLKKDVVLDDTIYVCYGIYKLIKQPTTDNSNNIFKLNIACQASIFNDVEKRLKMAFRYTFSFKKHNIFQEVFNEQGVVDTDRSVFHYYIEIDDKKENTVSTFEKLFFSDDYINKYVYKNNVEQEQIVDSMQPSLPVAQTPARIEKAPDNSMFLLSFGQGTKQKAEGLNSSSIILLTSIYYLSNYEFEIFSFPVEQKLEANTKKSSLGVFKEENGIVINNETVTIDAAKFKNFIENKVIYSAGVFGIIELWDSLKNATANENNKFIGYFPRVSIGVRTKVTNKLKQFDIAHKFLDFIKEQSQYAVSFNTNISEILEKYLFLPCYTKFRENPTLPLRETPLTFDRKIPKENDSVNNNNALDNTVQETSMELPSLPQNHSMEGEKPPSVVSPGTLFWQDNQKNNGNNGDSFNFEPGHTPPSI